MRADFRGQDGLKSIASIATRLFGLKDKEDNKSSAAHEPQTKVVSEDQNHHLSPDNTNLSGASIFQATVGKLFKNSGEIVVTDEIKQNAKLDGDGISDKNGNGDKSDTTNASIIIVGENAKIESSGVFVTNKLSITGEDVHLGGTRIDLLGDNGAIYVKAKDSIVVGNLATKNSLEVNANQYAFYADRFFLADGAILKDKGVLDDNRGLFVFANSITCSKNSLLDINSKILFENNSQDISDRNFLLPEIVTGKIIGNPILQIDTPGRHLVTAPLEVSQIVYPKDSIHVYFKDEDMGYSIGLPRNKLEVMGKFEELVLNLAQKQEYDDYWYLQPIVSFIIKNSNIDNPDNTYQVLKYIEQHAQTLDASLIKAKRELDATIIAKENNWRNTNEYKKFTEAVYAGIAQLIVKKAHEGIPNVLTRKQYADQPGKPNLERSAKDSASDDDRQFIQLIDAKLNDNQQDNKRTFDADGYDQYGRDEYNCDHDFNCLTGSEVRLLRIRDIINSKPGIKVPDLNLNVKKIYLEAGAKIESRGELKITAQEGIDGYGLLYAGGPLSVWSDGNIHVGPVYADNNIMLRAQEDLSVVGSISTDQKGDVMVFGKNVGIDRAMNIRKLGVYGNKIINFSSLDDKIGSAELIEYTEQQNFNANQAEAANDDNSREPQEGQTNFHSLDLYIKKPLEIAGDFTYVGKSFAVSNPFKVEGNFVLDTSEDFTNDLGNEITVGGNLTAISRGFINHGQLYTGKDFKLNGVYLGHDGGKISANSIKVYLTGRGPDGNSFAQRNNAILEARESEEGITLIAPNGGMYFGYKYVPTGAGVNKDGFTYVGSQMVSRSGNIFIQSGDNIVFDGAKVSPKGSFYVEAKGDVLERKIEGSYLHEQVYGVVRREYECVRDAWLWCDKHDWVDKYGLIDKIQNVVLEADVATGKSKTVIAGRDVIFSGVNDFTSVSLCLL